MKDLDKKTKQALAQAAVRVTRIFSRADFNPHAFIRRHQNEPPEALIETLRLVARQGKKLDRPWPYAETTLKKYKAPKASARRAEADHADMKKSEIKRGELNPVGALLNAAQARGKK